MTIAVNPLSEPTRIFEDSQSAICLTKNPQFLGRAKHIGIKYHFIPKQGEKGTVELQYCPTEEMVTDMLTKELSWDRFIKLRLMSELTQMPDSLMSEKECWKKYTNCPLAKWRLLF